MGPKSKDATEKVSVLKGQEAEDRVLAYLKKMNRPFGAVDVCANLKGAVPKSNTQKILMTLADKGEVTQKVYGKTTFFVAKQEKLEDMPAEKLAALEAQLQSIEEENKVLDAEVKAASTELSKLKKTPTNAELGVHIDEAVVAVKNVTAVLTPLRAGTPLISAAELTQMDADWTKWRAEWVTRRKIFNNLWHLVADSLPPQDSAELAEDLGIEFDTPEHSRVELSPLCTTKKK